MLLGPVSLVWWREGIEGELWSRTVPDCFPAFGQLGRWGSLSWYQWSAKRDLDPTGIYRRRSKVGHFLRCVMMLCLRCVVALSDQKGSRGHRCWRRRTRKVRGMTQPIVVPGGAPLQGATLVPYVEGNARGVCGAASTATSRQDAQMQ